MIGVAGLRMAALQRFEQVLAAEAQITQTMLRHEEKVPQGGPSMALAVKAAQAGGQGAAAGPAGKAH